MEYATVLTDVLLSTGDVARTLALKSRDAETCKTAAGHVLTEVFLEEQNKWAVVDAQFNLMPVLAGTPLNAVELQKGIIEQQPFELIKAGGVVSGPASRQYTAFIAPYLFYFETAFDHRKAAGRPLHQYNGKTNLMLVPLGARQPTVFQRRFPIDYWVYTLSLQQFYQPPAL